MMGSCAERATLGARKVKEQGHVNTTKQTLRQMNMRKHGVVGVHCKLVTVLK